MNAALPLEIVDLILLLSIQQDAFPRLHSRRRQASALPQTPSTSSVTTDDSVDHLIDVEHAAAVCRLSRHHRARFQPELYRHVVLSNGKAISRFGTTATARPDLSSRVESLAIFCDEVDGHFRQTLGLPSSSTVASLDADDVAAVALAANAILTACPNTTHLLLSCDQFSDLAAGVYRLHRPKEVSLVNVKQAGDLDGIFTRHRDLTAAALQNDPRIQAILGSSIEASQPDQSRGIAEPQSSSSSAAPMGVHSLPRAQPERSLSHLHLVNFDGRLLHHLAAVSSLTHLVLTCPILPETRPGVPGLSVISRSHLMLLLGSGNILRIVIRADLTTCVRLIEELAPIEDRKLIFRPICRTGDLLFPQSGQASSLTAGLSDQAFALYNTVAASRLDLLEEFHNRVRLHLQPGRDPRSSASDPDTSHEFSDPTSQGRSSDSSRGGTSQSGSTGWEEDEHAGRIRQQQDDNHFDEDVGVGEVDAEDLPATGLASRHLHGTTPEPTPRRGAMNAPPLNIPIEELLRSEGLTPAGLASRQNAGSSTSTPPSQDSSSAEPSSTSAGFTSPSSSSQSRRRYRQRVRRGPFVLRKGDLRGATQANLDVCAQLYEVLAANAGIEQEMHFW